MKSLPAPLTAPLVDLLLSLADDKFVLGHRNADWTGLGPILEEDIAFSSLAQDDLAHAGALYDLVADLIGDNAQRIAYGRRPEEYRCAQIVELADQFDWSLAVTRQFLCDHFDALRLTRLARSAHEPLAQLSRRMLAEEQLSLGHADQWIIRLGRAGGDAAQRVQAALDRLAEPAAWLLEPTIDVVALEQADVYPPLEGGAALYDVWSAKINSVVNEAGLRISLPRPDFSTPGGRKGRRSPDFAELYAELTEVYGVEPEAAW